MLTRSLVVALVVPVGCALALSATGELDRPVVAAVMVLAILLGHDAAMLQPQVVPPLEKAADGEPLSARQYGAYDPDLSRPIDLPAHLTLGTRPGQDNEMLCHVSTRGRVSLL